MNFAAVVEEVYFQLPSWDTEKYLKEEGYVSLFQLPSWDTSTLPPAALGLCLLSTPFLGYGGGVQPERV